MSEASPTKKRAGVRAGLIAAGVLVVVGCAAWGKLFTGASFLARYEDRDGAPLTDIVESRVEIPGPDRRIPAKLLVPGGGYRRAVLLVHGVHWKGYDEPRLLRFASTLCAMGFAVLVPDLEDLGRYELEPRAVDEIEASALWLLDESGLDHPDGKIGVFGISFAGGLSIGAAARESLAGRVAYAFSFGGHGDLDRTLRYLVTGEMPDGTALRPHVYGQAVVVRLFAERLVPADQADGLRSVLFDFLKDEKERARERLDELGPEARKLARLCVDRKVDELGEVLAAGLGEIETDPILSPKRGPVPDCPLFLLHGSVDNVIPPSESVALGKWAEEETDAQVLVSELIRHVDLEPGDEEPSWIDYYLAIRFWNDLLRM